MSLCRVGANQLLNFNCTCHQRAGRVLGIARISFAGAAHGRPMRPLRTIRSLRVVPTPLPPRLPRVVPSTGPCITKRFYTPDAVPDEDERHPRLKPEAQRLIRQLRRLLLNRQGTYASNFFNSVMGRTFINKDRVLIFLAVTDLFLVHGYLRQAMQAYTQMVHEGFIPQKRLKATIEVLRRVSTTTISLQPSDILEAAEPVVTQPSFDEQCLRYLLCKLCQVYKIHPWLLEGIVELFLQSRSHGYALSDQTRAYVAHLSAGLTSSVGAVSLQTDTPVAVEELPKMGTEDLVQLARSKPATPHEFANLFRTIFGDSVPDGAALKALILLFLKHRCYDYAFAFYGFHIHALPLEADAATFAMIFRAVTALSHRRSFRSRNVKKPANTPSHYDIFRDMLHCHSTHTRNHPTRPSHVINGSVLNRIVRTFTAIHDYPAAFITLRTFQSCSIPVTLATYRSVLGHLVARMEREIPFIHAADERSRWWTYRFLGRPSSHHIRADLHLINALLRVGQVPKLELSPLCLSEEDRDEHTTILPAKHRQIYVTPNAMDLVDTIRERKEYSPVPLLRILRRAILATPLEFFVAPAKYVSLIVAETKQAMLPTTLSNIEASNAHDVRLGDYAEP